MRCRWRGRQSPRVSTISLSCSAIRLLITRETLEGMRAPLAGGAAVVVLGFRAADPTGYGRLVMKGEDLVAIREHRDASPQELTDRPLQRRRHGVRRQIGARDPRQDRQCQQQGRILSDRCRRDRARDGPEAAVRETTEDEVRGINTKAQLAEAEQVMQDKLRKAAMDAGVTMVAPETVFLSADTSFRQGRDDRTVRCVRPRRPRRRRCGSALVLAYRRSDNRQGASIGPMRGCGRCASREGVACRQFRRDQGGHDRDGRQGQSPHVHRRRRRSARAPISARAPSPATMTASTSTEPRSAPAPLSAPTRRSSRRSKSARAPLSAQARW